MGSLAGYLQESFIRSCPQDWTCAREVSLLDPRLAKLFGNATKADVVLERADGTRKLWIEFEVSRAGPVANHAKFATAHLFPPQRACEHRPTHCVRSARRDGSFVYRLGGHTLSRRGGGFDCRSSHQVPTETRRERSLTGLADHCLLFSPHKSLVSIRCQTMPRRDE